MKDLFKRLKASGASSSGSASEPQLSLAAFGKHPGWDDHIPGIGLDTEALVAVKQAYYVGGIGGQIDSGAWEKLDPEKRLEGFDHTFIWLRKGHVVLGQICSSSDGKGRAKYPMVLSIDGQGVSPGYMLNHLLEGLERLHAACKATTSADRVNQDCQAAQAQLRTVLSQSSEQMLTSASSLQARQQFLARPEFGPDQLGLLRVLHELGNSSVLAASASGTAKGIGGGRRSTHVRIPLAGESRTEALVLGAEFLRCAIPEAVPLALIARAGVDWFDVILGPPASDDFFCLQASPKALPLATSIPYQLSPDLNLRLEEVIRRFLGTELPSAPAGKASSEKTRPPPVVPKASPRAQTAVKPKKPKWFFLTGGGGAMLIAVVLVGVWLTKGGLGSRKTEPAATSLAASSRSGEAGGERVHGGGESDLKYQVAVKAAQSAFERKDYPNAFAKAKEALAFRTNDPVATKVLDLAQQQLEVTAAREQKYLAALKAAQTALDGKDYSNALAKGNEALAIKPNDPVASKLLLEAQNQSTLVAAQEQKYQGALKAAQTALDGKDYSNALAKGNEALAIKPNDPAASKLLLEAQNQSTLVAAQEQKYQGALKAAQTALDGKDYSNALAKGNEALAIKPNDPAASKLLLEAQGQSTVVAEQEQKYQGALKAAQTALDGKDYSNALAKGNEALAIKPNDPVASKLLLEAQGQSTLVAAQEQKYQGALKAAQTALAGKDYSKALAKAKEALAIKPNDAGVSKFLEEAQKQSALAGALEQKYQVALKEAQTALERKNTTNALARAEAALSIKANDPAAKQLMAQAQDLRDSQISFDHGEYAKALELCTNHSGVRVFDDLAASISAEQQAIKRAADCFSVGDYSFIGPLKAQGYLTKPSVSALVSKATKEQSMLGELQAAKQTNGWQLVKTRLADQGSASFAAKKPFDELRKWAEATAKGDPDTGQLQRLDAEFEKLLVQFSVLSAKSPSIKSAEARKATPLEGQVQQDFYLDKVTWLESEYTKGGWLRQDDREPNLKKLRKAIYIH